MSRRRGESGGRQITTRLAINVARSARSRREAYIGPWLPEPVDTSLDPTLGAERGEALELAFLLLLERLAPTERAAYVLREAFVYPYTQIADILQLTPVNARQLVSRARKRLTAARHEPIDKREHRRLLTVFLDAAQTGNVAALENLFAADVVSSSDGGGIRGAARFPLLGSGRVAKFLAAPSLLSQLGGRQDMTEVSAGTLAEMLDERQHLLEIALWMSGSEMTADRIVQETYRRWYALDDEERAGIAVPRAWLTRVAGGICLELLATGAPRHAPDGTPRPGTAAAGPAHRPGPTPGRARWSEPAAGPIPQQARSDPAMLAEHDRVARRFAAACDMGDAAALRAVLAADAMVVSDGGGKLRAAVRPTYGADAVARFIAALLTGRPGTEVAVEAVNGRTGLVLRQGGRAVAVAGVSVAGAEVTAVWIVLNPDKLRRWHRP